MDNVDGSDHYATEAREPPPLLLNVIVDTNPYAWTLLKDTLPLSRAIANIEVFINAHLAFNHANQVTVIASHLQRAEFLYPTRDSDNRNSHTGRRKKEKEKRRSKLDGAGTSGDDVEMTTDSNGPSGGQAGTQDYANFYRPFADVKACLDSSLVTLMHDTEASNIGNVYSTSLAGALSLALTYTNKLETKLNDGNPTGRGLASSAIPTSDGSAINQSATLQSRILVISASNASASQYIPLMNTVFAAQRLRIPIDVLSIPLPTSASKSKSEKDAVSSTAATPSSFLQQAADATSGTFLPLETPHGLLQTLLMGFLPSGPSREMLIMPTMQGVDFRAACFCHQNTVDIGYVCSVCLSIFCGPPEDGACLTCGTPLKVGGEGWANPPAVLPKRKKKKRKREDGEGNNQGSRAETPA